jgi:hypothetical protein
VFLYIRTLILSCYSSLHLNLYQFFLDLIKKQNTLEDSNIDRWCCQGIDSFDQIIIGSWCPLHFKNFHNSKSLVGSIFQFRIVHLGLVNLGKSCKFLKKPDLFIHNAKKKLVHVASILQYITFLLGYCCMLQQRCTCHLSKFEGISHKKSS